MTIAKDQIESHGLKPDEYEKIKELLGRDANLLELGIFSAMWNEHCSYKSSKIHLKKLPTKNKNPETLKNVSLEQFLAIKYIAMGGDQIELKPPKMPETIPTKT